jgi:muconolactone delta-isomerase
MLYLVKAYADRASMNNNPDIAAAMAGEAQRSHEIRAEGRLIGLWRRADGNGSIFIVDAPSHEALAQDLRSLPMSRYWSHTEVIPIMAHPVHPDYGLSREAIGNG